MTPSSRFVPLSIESLEERTLLEANPNMTIPAALLRDPLILARTLEHERLNENISRVTVIQNEISRLASELAQDEILEDASGLDLRKADIDLESSIAERDRLNEEIETLLAQESPPPSFAPQTGENWKPDGRSPDIIGTLTLPDYASAAWFSPDGKFFYQAQTQTASERVEVIQFDTKTGAQSGRLDLPSDSTLDWRFGLSPNGSSYYTVDSSRRSLTIRNSATGEILRRWNSDSILINARFSHDGSRIAFAFYRKPIQMFDISSGVQLLESPPALSGGFYGFYGESLLIAVEARGPDIHSYDSKTGAGTLDYSGVSLPVAAAASPGGIYLAGGGLDREIVIWNMATGEALYKIPRSAGLISGIEWITEESFSVYTRQGYEGCLAGVEVYKIESGAARRVVFWQEPSVERVHPLADGTLVAESSEGGIIRLIARRLPEEIRGSPSGGNTSNAEKIAETRSRLDLAESAVLNRKSARDRLSQALADAMAETAKDGSELASERQDLAMAQSLVQESMLSASAIDAAVSSLVASYASGLQAQMQEALARNLARQNVLRSEQEASTAAQTPLVEKKHEIVSVPFSFTLRYIGPNAYALEAQNVPEGMSVILRRMEKRYDPSRGTHFQINGIVTGLGADGTEWFSMIPYAGGKFVDTMLEIAVQDGNEKTLASTTVDLSAIAVGKAATGTLPQITIQKLIETPADEAMSSLLSAPESPILRAVIEGSTVILRAKGIPPQTTMILRGPTIVMRDVVIPPGNGEITLPVNLAQFVSGKYTIQLVSEGKEIGAPLTFGPQAPVAFPELKKGISAPEEGRMIEASPQMQVIATEESCTVRYQFLEEGSSLEISRLSSSNGESSVTRLPGTQGSLEMRGRMQEGRYSFLISGPSGKTVVASGLYVPESSIGVITTNTIVSPLIRTRIDHSKTAPMLWISEIANDTFGGVTHNFTGPLGRRMLEITGLPKDGRGGCDALLGAFTTILKAKIGVPENLMPEVLEPLRTSILDHFDELYEAFRGAVGLQDAAIRVYRNNEAALWAAHDADQLAQVPTPLSPLAASQGPVSDEVFERTKRTILESHKDDPDGGAQTLVNYVYSSRRTTTMSEVAAWTGKLVATLQSLGVRIGTAAADTHPANSTTLLAMNEAPLSTNGIRFNWISYEKAAMDRLLSLYDPAHPIPGVRSDTLAGRVVTGFLSRLAFAEPQATRSRVEDIRRLTGVDLSGIDIGFLPPDMASDRVKAAFTEKGYGNLFSPEQSSAWQAHVGREYVAGDLSTAYTDADGEIRVRLDLPSDARDFAGTVSITDDYGAEVPGGRQIASFGDTMCVAIPMDTIRRLSPTGSVHKQFRLQVKYDRVGGAPVQVIVMSKVFRVDVETKTANLSFSAREIIGDERWNALSAADQNTIASALDFGSVVSEKNRTLITWLVNTYLNASSTETHKMIYDADLNEWVGAAYEAGEGISNFGGECKYWIDNDVVQEAMPGVDLPTNSGENSYQWEIATAIKEKASSLQGSLKNVIENINFAIEAGDLIQMSISDKSKSQHTVIIGKVESDGVWVFDSNYQVDHAPRYHKILFGSLNKYDLFTIYKIS